VGLPEEKDNYKRFVTQVRRIVGREIPAVFKKLFEKIYM